MTRLTRASDGHSFTFGHTTLYVGPGPRGSRGPVLAFVRPGAKKPAIVATFSSASTAEKAVDALRAAVDDLSLYAGPGRPIPELAQRAEVVTICGSSKFKAEILAEVARLTLEGNLVISLGVFGHSDLPDHNWGTDETDLKTMLDALHKQKIDMADSIHVVNPGGYYGESTAREIAYARSLGKPVTFSWPHERTDPPINRHGDLLNDDYLSPSCEAAMSDEGCVSNACCCTCHAPKVAAATLTDLAGSQTEHRMSPGSHEERYGPQCVCGAEWDWWNDKCTTA